LSVGLSLAIACRRKSKGMARLKVLPIALTLSALGIARWARVSPEAGSGVIIVLIPFGGHGA
jgi:hypothetical protein